MDAALELDGISKRFGRVTALDSASVIVRTGTVHALVGENGAGKTTLMHIAYGMVTPDGGRIRIRGVEQRLSTPLQAITCGLGMVHQHFTLVPAMTVQENLALGGRGPLTRAAMQARVERVAERTGFALDPDAEVGTLTVGAQQRVEIAKALARDATLLILDEPTAVLAPPEIAELLRWLRMYVAQGNAAVLITHKLHEAFAVADDITVLRRGRVVLAASIGRTTPAEVSTAMIGVAEVVEAAVITPAGDALVFSAEKLVLNSNEGRPAVREASFDIRSGEFIGIAAIEGAGQRELLRALAGRLDPVSGSLVRPASVGFVPEDRHADAVLTERSLVENVALRDAGSRRGRMPWKQLAEVTVERMTGFDVRAEGPSVPLRVLSGGNQQKLVLARELAGNDSVGCGMVVENPTRGLDVRATADVHRRLQDACAAGAAVVMYSSDIDEVLKVATRVLVLYGGVLREVPLDRDAVGRAMLGLN
jgi:ABC-type uncharacterized transport system ATPase subunit